MKYYDFDFFKKLNRKSLICMFFRALVHKTFNDLVVLLFYF